MLVTRKADYAVRCVLYLTKNQNQLATVGEISKAMQVPRSLLAKILQQLIKAGFVHSKRGIKGGFLLSRDPEKINLLEIIELIQKQPVINRCAVDGQKCDLSNQCSVHPIWIKLRKYIGQELREQNFKKLSSQQ
jgi:Rrf2 family protein